MAMFDKDAVIILNKPTGMSSFLAVKKVSRALGVKKAGHMGTLDPYGTGVLLVGVNRATKLFDEFLKKDKTYVTIFHFGYETDTIDSEGKIINSNNVIITDDDINRVLPKFIGSINQMPPQYSAKKINGKRSCDLVRSGGKVELKPKQITIKDIKLLKNLGNNNFLFEISCSAGTYIRSICRDLAYELSTYGTMVSIIRTKCGDFSIVDSCTIKDIENGNVSFCEVTIVNRGC